MKRLRCPKCDTSIVFDEKRYQSGRTLVFECPECKKQFKLRINAPQDKGEEQEETKIYGTLMVVENIFHFKQEIPLHMGPNVIGRSVKGTAANSAFITNDPSVDTTHCEVNVKLLKNGRLVFALSDRQSNTGTFLMTKLLGPGEQAYLTDKDVITIGATTMIFELSDENTSSGGSTE